MFRKTFRLLSTAAPAKLDASKIKVVRNASPGKLPALETLTFGRTFTDHMFTVQWSDKQGWHTPSIVPYGPLSLDPSCLVFHYAIECFEGLKAYKDSAGKTRLFRPDLNMARLNTSGERLGIGRFDEAGLLDCLKALLRVDEHWIPQRKGYSLYIRPTMIATQASLGVTPTNQALLYILCCPVGPYYPTGFKPVSLLASDKYVRAWPHGTGGYKLGLNYAPGIVPQLEAAKQGHQQVLWLLNGHISEVGTMNLFVYWQNKKTKKNELITPPLDGTILPGVTRRSILEMTRGWGEFDVTEAPIAMKDVCDAQKEGRLLEVFGAGTAAVVSPVKNIHYEGVDYKVPVEGGEAGKLARRLLDEILKIQYGEVPHKWSVIV